MGFQSQKNVLFKSEEISFDLIVHLVNNRFAYSKSRNETGGRTRPAVAIDASLIGFQFLSKSCGPAGALRIITKAFVDNYIDVHIVVDGPNRHHSKRATIKRQGQRALARIELMKKQVELATSIQDESSSSGSHVDDLQAKIRRLENVMSPSRSNPGQTTSTSHPDEITFETPLVPLVPLLGIAVNWYLIAQLEWSGLLFLFGYLGGVSALYYVKTG